MEERIAKFLASAGVASRRKCEEIILDGKVTIDGDVVTSLSTKVDAELNQIRVDGDIVKAQKKVYYVMYKPKGLVCSNSDEQGRETVISVFPVKTERLHTVGRLDKDSEGLLLLTNDGEFTKLMTHPRHELKKRYEVVLKGSITPEATAALRKGMWLDGKKTQPASVRVIKKNPKTSLCEIGLEEGINRQIRRMLSRVGFPVKRLVRTHIGHLSINRLKPGQFRMLDQREITRLVNKARG